MWKSSQADAGMLVIKSVLAVKIGVAGTAEDLLSPAKNWMLLYCPAAPVFRFHLSGPRLSGHACALLSAGNAVCRQPRHS
ncbi:UNKNOWN [Stylonychia lemnae]|uniref:Uncharacterized protein n=1 Tax=Stylonychia lemnae TaxID=5949 RepID=A0A078ADE6_STYLE|nr:UNKNOWN [Stylonychia lemnae]|eukprot:CDW79557.1 UNKNOWN [Stylonychia lemnae]